MDTKIEPFLAKALYDNLAESPDELAFRRGDIITVLEVNTQGLDGWYRCALRNKQGIAPGNRLKLVTGMQSDVTVVPQFNRLSFDTTLTPPQQVVLPEKIGDTHAYGAGQSSKLDYDVPTSRPFQSDPYARQTPPQSTMRYSSGLTDIDYDTPSRNVVKIDASGRLCSTPDRRSNDVDYDTPSPRNSTDKYNTFSPGQRAHNYQSDYNTPSRNSHQKVQSYLSLPRRGNSNTNDIDYDTPTSKNIVRNLYDVKRGSLSPDHPASDRSSILSVDSAATFSSNYSIQSDLHSGQATSGIGSTRSSFDITAQDYYDVPTPRAVVSRDSGLDQDYDQPKNDGEDYDMPRLDDSAYESPKITSQTQALKNLSIMNSPRAKLDSQDYDSPSSRVVEGFEEDYDAPVTRDSLDYDDPQTPKNYIPEIGDQDTLKARKHGSVYDVPPQVTRDSVLSTKSDSSDGLDDSRFSESSLDRSFDVTSSFPDLPIALDSAMDLITRLQQDVKKCVLNLLSKVSSNWRKREIMESRVYDVKMSCSHVVASLKAFVEFAHGALANSTKVSDKKLTKKLHKQIQLIQQLFEKIDNSYKNLEQVSWNLMYLVEQKDSRKTDDLGVIINTTKVVMNDVRKIASTIQGNSSLLFRKSYIPETKQSPEILKPTSELIKPVSEIVVPTVAHKTRATPEAMQHRPLPKTPDQSLDSDKTLTKTPKKLFSPDITNIVDEYDYVHLSSRKMDKPQETADDLNYDEVPPHADTLKNSTKNNTKTDNSTKLEHNDLQVLMYYNKQIELHADELTNSIDFFFKGIEQNCPPREFVAHGKLVILAAHKLVFAGDTMHRNLMHKLIRDVVMCYANELCDLLKDSVNATKTAALQYPSVNAMQEMVDRIVKVSQSAKKFRAYVHQSSLCSSV